MISIKAKKITSFWEKSRGLIGKKKIETIYFKTRWGVHTFGVLFPIDVLILDNKLRVVKIVPRLAPNRFLFWNPIYQNVVELPNGKISQRKIVLGDIIVL